MPKLSPFDPDEDTDTIPEADKLLFSRRVLDRYAQGDHLDVIAFDEGVNHWNCWKVIQDSLAEVREKNRQKAEERFLQQDLGILAMIRKCNEQLRDKFSIDLVRVLITLYERQAKLWALDRSQNADTGTNWAATASAEDLIRKARSLGIKLPEPIAPHA